MVDQPVNSTAARRDAFYYVVLAVLYSFYIFMFPAIVFSSSPVVSLSCTVSFQATIACKLQVYMPSQCEQAFRGTFLILRRIDCIESVVCFPGCMFLLPSVAMSSQWRKVLKDNRSLYFSSRNYLNQIMLYNKEQNVEECDATGFHSRCVARFNKKINLNQ